MTAIRRQADIQLHLVQLAAYDPKRTVDSTELHLRNCLLIFLLESELMRKVSWVWKETAEIIGVLGVIGSLIFVAFEIGQNNELLAAEARANRHENRSQNSNRQFLENPHLADLIVRANNGASLTEVEQYTIERFFNQTLLDFQFVFVEYQRGQFDEYDLALESMKSAFYRNSGMQRYWNESAEIHLRPDFVLWMNENIVDKK